MSAPVLSGLRARARRLSAFGLAAVLVGGTLALLVPAPAHAAESLSVSKSSTAEALVGDEVEVSLSATNTGDAPEYNLSFRDQLPAGVTYVPGSTKPSESIGEPVVVTGGDPERQTLVWTNVSDLPMTASQGLSFRVEVDSDVHPVGSSFDNVGEAYASSDPRTVPKFDDAGAYTTGATAQGSSSAAETAITAIEVTKTEPSPEGELRRGVHNHSTKYTLTVRNNSKFDDDDVVLVDLIPAGMEYLACGTEDNTSGDAREYPGAPRLDVSTPDVTPCVAPDSVETVTDPAGVPAGVYTRVRWDLGTLGPGDVEKIVYRAGIPQRANVAFPDAGAPTPASGGQGANLDNNTGASTREVGEQALTNYASVTAQYAGPTADGNKSVGDDDRVTVTAEDLAVQKSVTPGLFTQGDIATYTLELQTGEYADATGIVLTDVLPNGLCPLDDTANYATGSPADCDPGAGFAPSLAYDTVEENPDGGFTVTFDPIDIDASGTATVTYQARMLKDYRGGETPPTVAGDGFTNTVSLAGTTTTLASVDPPGGVSAEAVTDGSSASIASEELVLSKLLQPAGGVSPYACENDPAAYEESSTLTDAQVTFREGDRVCFALRVDFPEGTDAKNAVLKDFLPEDLTYETGSLQPLTGNDVAVTSGDSLTMALGETRTGGGDDLFVDPGSTLLYRLSAIVGDPPLVEPEVTGNLAKLTWEDTDGNISFLRQQEDFTVAPAPPLSVLKSADRHSATPPGATGPLRDADEIPDDEPAPGVTEWVRIGDVVDFTVAVTNEGVAEDRNDVSVVGPDVWDVLPDGIACDDLSLISNGGVCTDPGDLGHPTFSERDTRSAVRWERPDTVSIAAGDTLSLTYRVTYPTSVSPDTTYRNDAAVASYQAGTNRGGLADHYPEDNVDTTVAEEDEDAPRAADSHALLTPRSGLTKSNETEIADGGQGTNTSRNYAVVGETVTYTVVATVPADTRVYSGVLTDTAPTGVRVDSVRFAYRSSPALPYLGLPPGFTASSSPTPRVTFPAELDVGAQDDQVRMIITATVIDADANVHDRLVRNTARLVSSTVGGDTATNRAATSDVRVAEPSPAPLKSADDTTPVAGQEVTYTVTARNADPANPGALRPVLHDAVLVDCVPAGLTLQPTPAVTAGSVTEEAAGTQGCAAGTTPLRWDVGDLAWRSPADAGGAQPWPTLTYDAVVDPAAGGKQAYTNVAGLTGSSLSGADADERAYSQDASETVTVPGAGVGKSVAEASEPVGGTSSFTVQVDLPVDVNFYEATILDTLPAGIDPATTSWVSSSCAYTDDTAGACDVTAASESGLTPVGQVHGFYLGDVTSDPRPRRVTVTYSAVVGVVDGNTAGTALTNRAALSWNQTNNAGAPAADATFDASSDADTASVTVTEPSLTIGKKVNVAEPTPGQTFTYTVEVTNASGATRSDAHAVDVVDTLPAGVQVVGSPSNGGVAAGGSPAGGTVTWTDLGPIAPGATVTLNYDARLASPAPKTDQVNSASVTEYTSLSSADGGGRTYAGEKPATATVSPALPVLEVDKTVAGKGPAYLGEAFGWRIEVENTGSATAYDVDVTDVLPSDWDYDADSARVTVAGGAATSVEPTTSGSPVQTLTWDNLGDLAVDQKIVVTFDAVPASSLAPDHVGSGVAQKNEATATGQDLDGDDGSVITTDTDTAQTQIDEADLGIEKKASGTPVAGESFSWTLTVTNNGADEAAGPFTVTDDLPAEVTGATGSGTGWTCSSAAGKVTCERTSASDTLASGASFPDITITADVPDDVAADTEIDNSGSVSARTYDPVATNDSDSVAVSSRTVSDMGIVKKLVGDLTPGTKATYAITVTNHGPSVARGAITVTDTLPDGLTYRSFEGTGWTLDRTGQELELTWAGATPVAVGAMPQITVVVDVDSALTSEVANTAAVTEPTDPTAGKEANDSSTVTTKPSPSADLRLDKSSPGDVKAGEQATYRLAVRNLGPSDAAGTTTVTDTLPDGVTYKSVTSDEAWSCSAKGQDVTCTLAGGLADEGTTSLDLTVDVAETATGDLENSATVSSSTSDPNSGNNTGTDNSGITVESDLAIDKALPAKSVVAGERATYTLTVSNNGPASSPGPIVVTDTLADSLTLVSISGTGWTCTGTTELECTRPGPLAADADAPVLTLVTTVDSGAGGTTLANSANVSGPATDPTPANNTDTVSVTVGQDAEVAIDKTVVGSGTVAAGDTVEFTLQVTSTGPSDARDVSVTDVLPDGLSLVSVKGDGWTCDTLTCSLDAPAAAGKKVPALTLVATVGAGVRPGTLTNEAEVKTATPGDEADDNKDSADVKTVVSADLALTKKAASGTVVAGESTSFDLTVSNGGPSDNAGPITVTDTLPEGMSFLSANAPWSCDDGAALVCTLKDGLTAGGTATTLTIQVQVAQGTPKGDLTNKATVSSDDPDPDAKNDTGTADVTVARFAELSVVKTHDGPVRIGDDLSFELVVSNTGPSDARGLVLTDTLPEGLAYVSASGDDWTCKESGDTVTCSYGKPLPAKSDAPTVTVVATVGAAAYSKNDEHTVTNTATVSSDEPDKRTDDNTSTDLVEVPAQVDLGIAKSAAGKLVVGREATYELEVTNHGPTDAPGTITVTDTLPTGLSGVAAEGDGWTCSIADPTVTCERDDPLANGASSVVTVVVEVEAEAYPSVTNTAVVSSDAEDTNKENDTAELTSEVTPTVDLSMDKSVVASGPGGVLYQLTVTNGGPNATVEPVQVRDPLPSSLRFYSVEAKGWSCSTSPRLVTCAYPKTLEVGESASLMLTTRIVAKPGTRIRNVASVLGGGARGAGSDDAVLVAASADDGGKSDGGLSGGDAGDGDGDTDSLLPDTGGPWAWLWLLGAGMVAGGGLLLRRRRATGVTAS